MKKIYESPLNGWDESAERIHVYALENDEEFWKFNAMQHSGFCIEFDVCDESSYDVAPGAMYHKYSFNLEFNHIIMCERVAYNV